jgi:hypothetical protein
MATTTQIPEVRRRGPDRDKTVMSGSGPVIGRPMSRADPGGVMPVARILMNTRSKAPVTGTEGDGNDDQHDDRR